MNRRITVSIFICAAAIALVLSLSNSLSYTAAQITLPTFTPIAPQSSPTATSQPNFVMLPTFTPRPLAATPIPPTATPPARDPNQILREPFNGSPRITSYFDHRYPNYAADGQVTIYTGETTSSCAPYCYNGHSGFDYGLNVGAPILAAADGIVVKTATLSTGYGFHIVIDHGNQIHTLYGHLSAINVSIGQRVSTGERIGSSGNTGNSSGPHLHFGVYRGAGKVSSPLETMAIDPFGWQGVYADPMLSYPSSSNSAVQKCVWRSLPNDLNNCGDIIVESAGRGFVTVGTWYSSPAGNGYHFAFARNGSNTHSVDWQIALPRAGKYIVSAYIPAYNASTRGANYRIHTASGWQTVTLDQQNFNDQWATLGTFDFNAGETHVWLSGQTNEPVGSTWIAADSMRFRPVAVSVTAANGAVPPSYNQREFLPGISTP